MARLDLLDARAEASAPLPEVAAPLPAVQRATWPAVGRY